MKVFFERRDELAPCIFQYYFTAERPLNFVAGQYIHLRLPAVPKDSRGPSRTFTLTSLPGVSQFSFVVKILYKHSPYKEALIALEQGDEATIDDAMGDLVLPKSPTVPLVFIAGGIGIASYVGMLSHLLAKREQRDIYVFYALRSRSEQIFSELMAAYPLQLKQVIYAPNRLSAHEVRASTPPDALVYLSGSQQFVEGLRADLEMLGTPHRSIVFDYYDGYTEL